MGQGKGFGYKKILREYEELRLRGGRFVSERVTAIYGGITSTGEWAPAVDVYETKSSLYLVAELAGVPEGGVQVEVCGNVVTLRGVRPHAREGVSSENVYRMECPRGSFERSFSLPYVVEEKSVRASLRDGILRVEFPRRSAGGEAPRGRGGK